MLSSLAGGLAGCRCARDDLVWTLQSVVVGRSNLANDTPAGQIAPRPWLRRVLKWYLHRGAYHTGNEVLTNNNDHAFPLKTLTDPLCLPHSLLRTVLSASRVSSAPAWCCCCHPASPDVSCFPSPPKCVDGPLSPLSTNKHLDSALLPSCRRPQFHSSGTPNSHSRLLSPPYVVASRFTLCRPPTHVHVSRMNGEQLCPYHFVWLAVMKGP